MKLTHLLTTVLAAFAAGTAANIAPAFAPAIAPVARAADSQRTATQPVYRDGNWRKYRQTYTSHIAAATAALNKGDGKLIFVGDSITEGWAAEGRSIWNKYYASRNAINLGLSADRTQSVLFRLRELEKPMSKTKPKAVVLLIGYNNISAVYDGKSTPSDTVDGIKAVITRLKKSWPNAKYIVLSVLPAADTRDAERIKKVNDILKKKIPYGVIHLDLTNDFAQSDGKIKPHLTKDGVHLSTAGYQLWAEKLEPKLKGIL